MAARKKKQTHNFFDHLTNKATVWMGSSTSIVVHTILFVIVFLLAGFGVSLDTVLLILTTAVSLEAIYLAIFIQRSVNQQSQTIATEFDELEEAISEDIDETEAVLMKDLDDTEKQLSDDIDETERGIMKQTPKALEKPLDEVIDELRTIIREEVRNAIRDRR